ncbi:nucleotidyltransferase domain-containing protein [Flavobacterium sp. FlaQc-47]|uniref:nucleotidyltransferase domain-containing protein n=1 Tax=Flavobacterium sp. FlaQc-47 TaxID=3374180 RepID=UPI00375832ED
MKLNKDILKEITIFVNKYYSNQYACLISGSYVDGTNSEYSDIDVVVFVQNRNTVFNEMVSYKKLKIQAMIIPVQNIQETLWMDYITAKGAFIGMLAKGVIVFDHSNFLKHLIPHAKQLRQMGCMPLTDHEVYMMRVKITSLLYDIMDGKSLDELLFTITQIIDLTTEFKLRMNRIWCGKYKIKSLGELDKTFQTLLLSAVEEIFGNKNKIPLIDLATSLLNQHGGLLPYYSKANSLTKVYDDYLVIEIDNNSNLEIVKKTIAVLNDFGKQIVVPKLKYYFFLSKPINVNKVEQNIYMIIEADKDFINDYLIDRLEFLVKNKREIAKLIFPFQFDPVYKFSTKNIYASLTPMFRQVSKLIIEKPNRIFDTSFQIEWSVSLMKEIKKIWFKDDSNVFVAFNEYLLNCFLPITCDNGMNFKTTDLLKDKENTLKKFEAMYNSQKREFTEIYNSSGVLEKSITKFLINSAETLNIEGIPLYKTYFINDNLKDINVKQWSLYREILFTLFSVVFIDNRFVSFIPFVIKKIELND